MSSTNCSRHRSAWLWSFLALLGLVGFPQASAAPPAPAPAPSRAISPNIGASRAAMVVREGHVALENGRAIVPLEASAQERADLKVMSPQGETWRNADDRLKVQRGKLVLNLQKNEVVYVRSKTTQPITLSTEKAYFDGTLVQASTTGGRAAAHTWRLFLKARNDPVTWRPQLDAYSTHLVVGVEDEASPQEETVLPSPLTIQFFSQGAGVDVEPAKLALRESGSAGFIQAVLRCRSHTSGTAVEARGSFGEQELRFRIQPALGSLQLESSRPRTVPAFGLGTTALTVQRLAEDGTAWAPEDPLLVSLHAGRGELPPTLQIPSGASQATAILRSAGIGPVRVSASTASMRSNVVDLAFVIPWLLLAAMVVGGGLGGLVGGPKDGETEDLGHKAFRVLSGIIGGAALVCVIAVGVVQVGFPTPPVATEAGTFGLAAVGGYGGPKTLSWLLKTVFGI